MTRRDNHPAHRPENAEHEIRKAYNCVIETGVTHFWEKHVIPGVIPDEVSKLYKHSFECLKNQQRLSAERWARTAKHLARALWHEAKIAYLEPRTSELPLLEGATPEEFNLHEHSDTTEDLLNSTVQNIPSGMTELPPEMARYLSRARLHLQALQSPDYQHELLRAERIKAAHEYARTLECIALAYEAEGQQKPSAA